MRSVNTDDADDYNTLWLPTFDTHSLIFTVRTCSNAQIILCELPGIAGDNCFEFVIGHDNNRETLLRRGKGGQVVTTVPSPNTLNCNDLKALWISWGDNIISFGRGITVGVSRVVAYTDDSKMKINAVSIATVGNAGHWQFNEVDGKKLVLVDRPETFIADIYYHEVIVQIHCCRHIFP